MTSTNKDLAYWERHAKRYDTSTRFLARPIPRMLELVSAAISPGDRVLEVAAGTGLVTSALTSSAREVVATDYAEAMVRKLAERMRADGASNVLCERADIYDLAYTPASFDVVVAANVLHLVPDLDAALTALARMVRPGGTLVLPTYCHSETVLARIVSRLFALTGFPGKRRFSVATLREAVERHDLRVQRVDRLPGVIPIGYVQATRAG